MIAYSNELFEFDRMIPSGQNQKTFKIKALERTNVKKPAYYIKNNYSFSQIFIHWESYRLQRELTAACTLNPDGMSEASSKS